MIFKNIKKEELTKYCVNKSISNLILVSERVSVIPVYAIGLVGSLICFLDITHIPSNVMPLPFHLIDNMYDKINDYRDEFEEKASDNSNYKLKSFNEYISLIITKKINDEKINVNEIDKKFENLIKKEILDSYKDSSMYEDVNNYSYRKLIILYSLNKYFNKKINIEFIKNKINKYENNNNEFNKSIEKHLKILIN